ncbi:MAG: SCO family protein [Vicinamibacteria bacterium]
MRVLLTASVLAAAALAQAQERPTVLRDVGFDQRLDQVVPNDIALRDENGRDVRLADYLGKKPVVLALVYYECPSLCTMTLNGLVSAMNAVSFDAGKEYDVVTVSFEPRETPALATAKKTAYLKRYQRPGAAAGWHFLTGEPAEIARLTQAVGFRYTWDERTRQYAHPSGVVVLTPEGRIARYLFGIEYAPKDLRFALVEASEGRVGGVVDQAILYCYQYDPMTGKYGTAILRLLRVASLLTLAVLGTFIFTMWRRERRVARAALAGSTSA